MEKIVLVHLQFGLKCTSKASMALRQREGIYIQQYCFKSVCTILDLLKNYYGRVSQR